MVYFLKELPQTKVIFSNGKSFTLDEAPDGNGYLATDDGFIINEIRALIAKRVGGFVEITEAAYIEAVKKNSDMQQRGQTYSQPPTAPPLPPSREAAAAVEASNRWLNVTPQMPKPLAAPPPGKWKPRIGPPPSVP